MNNLFSNNGNIITWGSPRTWVLEADHIEKQQKKTFNK